MDARGNASMQILSRKCVLGNQRTYSSWHSFRDADIDLSIRKSHWKFLGVSFKAKPIQFRPIPRDLAMESGLLSRFRNANVWTPLRRHIQSLFQRAVFSALVYLFQNLTDSRSIPILRLSLGTTLEKVSHIFRFPSVL